MDVIIEVKKLNPITKVVHGSCFARVVLIGSGANNKNGAVAQLSFIHKKNHSASIESSFLFNGYLCGKQGTWNIEQL